MDPMHCFINETPELENPPTTFRSTVWEHYRFLFSYDGITRMCFLAETDRSKVFLSAVFKKPLTADLDCAKAITHSIGVFMAADMWPPAYRECRFYVYGRCVWATIRLHESIFVSLLCQPCVNEWKLQLFRNYQLHSPLMDGPLGLHRAT